MEPTQPHIAIVGAGPAGMILAHILARQAFRVTLLELHDDFDRDFRGDTLHASTLEVLAQLGLAESVLELPHEKMHEASIHTPTATYTVARFKNLSTNYPYIALMPQSELLEFLDQANQRYPSYQCLRGAAVNKLIYTPQQQVCGVGYRSDNADHELHADVVIGADGRFSRLRKLAKLSATEDDQPVDVAWCRVPRPEGLNLQSAGGLHVHGGQIVVLLPRDSAVQLGCVFSKGQFRHIKQAGINQFRQRLQEAVPALADSADAITSWDQVHLLNVRSDMLDRWYAPGLLLIGDAAHVMSPVGGIGINCAVADAVATANIISEPLRQGTLNIQHLAAVQARRARPTRLIQRGQAQILSRVGTKALQDPNFVPPWPIRALVHIPGLRLLPARMAAFGPQPEQISAALRSSL